jgi:hypothetical protein
MSKILKRPMFRKGGSADGGVMKIANPRSNFDGGGAAKRYEENLKLLQQAAGPAGDSKQDLYDMLISGGLNLVSGEGAGKGTLGAIAQSFKKPAEQFLAATTRRRTVSKTSKNGSSSRCYYSATSRRNITKRIRE